MKQFEFVATLVISSIFLVAGGIFLNNQYALKDEEYHKESFLKLERLNKEKYEKISKYLRHNGHGFDQDIVNDIIECIKTGEAIMPIRDRQDKLYLCEDQIPNFSNCEQHDHLVHKINRLQNPFRTYHKDDNNKLVMDLFVQCLINDRYPRYWVLYASKPLDGEAVVFFERWKHYIEKADIGVDAVDESVGGKKKTKTKRKKHHRTRRVW